MNTTVSITKQFKYEQLNLLTLPKSPLFQNEMRQYKIKYVANFDDKALKKQLIKRSDIARWDLQNTPEDPHLLSFAPQRPRFKISMDKNLFRGIRSSKKMSSFRLDIPKDNVLTMKKLVCLLRAIKRFTMLKKISFNLAGCQKMNHIVFQILSKGLKRIRSLKVIALNLEGMIGAESILINGFKRLSLLKSLSLKLEKCEVREEELLMPVRAFRRHCSLRDFDFMFGEDQIRMTGVSLPRLNRSLKSLDDFKRILSLDDFKWIKVMNSPNDHQAIGVSLLLNQDIRKMSFSKTFEDLGRLESLQSFSLDFNGCQWSINQMVMPLIRECLEKMTSLKSLSLNFSKTQLLYESGLFSLSKALKNLNKLEIVHIIFPKVFVLKEQGLRELGITLTGILSLKKIELTFESDPLKPSSFDLRQFFSRKSPKIDLSIQ